MSRETTRKRDSRKEILHVGWAREGKLCQRHDRKERHNGKRDSRKSGKSHCMKRKRRERDKWNETLEEKR